VFLNNKGFARTVVHNAWSRKLGRPALASAKLSHPFRTFLSGLDLHNISSASATASTATAAAVTPLLRQQH